MVVDGGYIMVVPCSKRLITSLMGKMHHAMGKLTISMVIFNRHVKLPEVMVVQGGSWWFMVVKGGEWLMDG